MRRIDRYILGGFLRDYAVCLAVLVGLYVTMDAMFNFDEFAERAGEGVGEVLAGVAGYYAAQAVFVYGQLCGVIAVAAAAFTFARMSRFNEVVALLSAGVPMLRIALPVVVAAAAINFVVQPVVKEVIVPRLGAWLTLDRDEAVAGEAGRFAVRSMPLAGGGLFDAASFVAGERPRAEGVTVVERPRGGPAALVTAEAATWDADAALWLLDGGRRVTGLAARPDGGSALAAPESRAVAAWSAPGAAPADVMLFRAAGAGVGVGGSQFDLLSLGQIDAMLRRPGRAAPASLVRAKHARLASYAMNLVLVGLAVPAVLTRQPGQLKRAAGRTLVLIGAAMAATFLCQTIAGDPPRIDAWWAARWPAVVSWLPVFAFGPLAVVMLDRMET